MKKSTYFTITCLLLGNYWKNTFTDDLNIKDIMLVIGWLWGILGFTLFWRERQINRLFAHRNIKLIFYVFFGVFFSSISAIYYHDENLFQVLIAQRQTYNLMFFPLFLYIKPSLTEIEDATKKLAIIAVVLFAISIKYPLLFMTQEYYLYSINHTTNIGANTPGIFFILIYLYFLLEKITRKFSLKLFFEIAFYFVIIILYQNRSTLIGVSVAYIFVLFKISNQYKYFTIGFIIIIFVFVFSQFAHILQSLSDETLDQINNPNYARWNALRFFLFDYQGNLFVMIFGNGTPTIGSQFLNNLLYASETKGAFVSDIGLLGMYYYYGIIPLTVIYYMIFKVLLIRSYPFFLKFLSLHILLVPTIFEFAWGGALLFSIIFYLFSYSSSYIDSVKVQPFDEKKCKYPLIL